MLSEEKMKWYDGLASAGSPTDIITVGRCNWRELVATIRELQARVAEAMSYFIDPNDPGSLPKYTADYGPTLLNQIQGLAGYYEEMMDEQEAEERALRARVAEIEEIKRRAIEQSEYIQTHGLTEYEMARLKARVAELEGKMATLRAIFTRPQPVDSESVSAWIGELWEVLYKLPEGKEET